jgi:hypothetical protein
VYVEYAGGTDLLSFPATSAGTGRIDLVSIDDTGTINRTAGVASASPVQPDFPEDELVLAIIDIPVDATGFSVITGDFINNLDYSKYFRRGFEEYLDDNLYIKSEDGGYAANELLAYKDATGRIAKTTNALIKRTSDGDYGGTGDNDIPSENRIGDVTDFKTGQGGSSGGSAHQQLGKYIRDNEIKTPGKICPISNSYGLACRSASLSLTSAGEWVTIAEIEEGLSTIKSFSALVQYVFASSVRNGAFYVSGIISETYSTFDIKFTPLNNSDVWLPFVGPCRIISSNDTTDRGSKLQMKSFHVTSGSILLRTLISSIDSSGAAVLTPVTPYVDNTSIQLPDGSSFATYGQASDDWWRFGQGEIVLWSGSQTVDNGLFYSDIFFTGFNHQMFNSYIAIFSNSGETYESNCPVKKPIATNDSKFVTTWGSGAVDFTIYYSNANDFIFTNYSGNPVILKKIIGVL